MIFLVISCFICAGLPERAKISQRCIEIFLYLSDIFNFHQFKAKHGSFFSSPSEKIKIEGFVPLKFSDII